MASDSLWDFAQKLSTILGRESDKNFLVSPLSAYLALSAAMIGAKGATKNELAALLMGSECNQYEEKAFFEWVKVMSKNVQSSEEITVAIANKVVINKSEPNFKLLPSAVKKLKELARIEAIDFGDKEATDASINEWVKNETRGKIGNMVDELNALDKMVILNAIYFKGDWDSPFSASNTVKRSFYSSGKKIRASFMYKSDTFNFANVAELDAKVLQINYRDEACTMMIVLPNRKGSLEAVEQKMQTMKLKRLVGMLAYTRVELHIPKFKIEADFELSKALKELGCTTMFSMLNSDFTGFCDTLPYPLFVASVQQKTFIDVNEKGTEAAAATSVRIQGGCARGSKPEVFDANHPFLFYLIHHLIDDEKSSPTVLFNGRVCVPEQSAKSKKA